MKTNTKKGRPSAYNINVVEQIVKRLASGERVTRICREEGMPAYRTVWEWRQDCQSPNALAFRALMERQKQKLP